MNRVLLHMCQSFVIVHCQAESACTFRGCRIQLDLTESSAPLTAKKISTKYLCVFLYEYFTHNKFIPDVYSKPSTPHIQSIHNKLNAVK